MKRKIIKIDEEKCTGCGICATACHEGAIGIVNGKAKLLKENFCDGFGDCLPGCPSGAISFEEREAPSYDEEAVKKYKAEHPKANKISKDDVDHPFFTGFTGSVSELTSWPVQLKLAPVDSVDFDRDILIAADCTAYAYANFHKDFMANKSVLIGCPKLDGEDYSEKLTQIFKYNNVKSVTLVIMEVPCCSRMVGFVQQAILDSHKIIPLDVKVLSLEGEIIA